MQKLRGENVLLTLVTELIKISHTLGYKKIFTYTKADNEILFKACGFSTIVKVNNDFVLMENSYENINQYCKTLMNYLKSGKKIGSIVMNANPFTLGHQYLIEQASKQVDWLHIFVVKEDLSFFSYQDRFNMVIDGCNNFSNVTVHQGNDYIISRATFPTYFLKEENIVNQYYMEMDLKIFREYIAPSLNINYRFVGTEPNCIVTNNYNQQMKSIMQNKEFKGNPIEVIELNRLKSNNNIVISASEVRKLLNNKKVSELVDFLPTSTLNYLYKIKVI